MSAQWSVCLATQRSVCVVVQFANWRKARVEVQRNTDGDTPYICVAAHADLRICDGHVILQDLLGSYLIY